MSQSISGLLKRISLVSSPAIARNRKALRSISISSKAKVLSPQVHQTQQTSTLPIPERDAPPSSTLPSSSKVHHVLKDRPFEPDTLMEIVHILNGANIPSILWGNSLLDIYGVPTVDFNMSLLVKRRSIEEARQLLLSAGLVECTSPTCYHRRPNSTTPITLPNGHVHFHISEGSGKCSSPTIQLHIRDERIWTLPSEDNISHTDKNIIMAFDNRLRKPNWGIPAGNKPQYGRCRHYYGSPVRILTPECYADALVLLMVRDRGTMATITWSTQINYLLQYGLYKQEKVHSATRNYMNFRSEASSSDRFKEVTNALKDTAEKGKLFASWAK